MIFIHIYSTQKAVNCPPADVCPHKIMAVPKKETNIVFTSLVFTFFQGTFTLQADGWNAIIKEYEKLR